MTDKIHENWRNHIPEAERLAKYDEQLSAICRQVPKYAPELRKLQAENDALRSLLKRAAAAMDNGAGRKRTEYLLVLSRLKQLDGEPHAD